MFKNAIQPEERPKHAPICDGHFDVNGQVEVCSRTPRQCSHLFEVCWRTSEPPKDSIGATVESWGIIEYEKMLLRQGTCRLLGSRNKPCQILYIDKVTKTIWGLQHHTNMTELKLFMGLCNVFQRFVPNIARIATTLNCKLEKDKPFHFGWLNEIGIKVLETLHHQMRSPRILSLFRLSGRYTFDSNVCEKQLAGSYWKSILKKQQTPWGTGHDLWTRLNRHVTQCIGNVLL